MPMSQVDKKQKRRMAKEESNCQVAKRTILSMAKGGKKIYVPS